MARPIWTGSLSFGLVNVPVGLYSATEDLTVHFNQFQAGTSDRVRNKRVNERTGDEVPYSDIVKGYDLGGGQYVVVSPEELEAVEPGRTRTIEISDFVDLDQIDPVYFKSAYYLAPHGSGSDKPYALLRRAMEDANKVGLATFVFRSKQHLVAVRPAPSVLALETMYYADEVRDPSELGALPDAGIEFSSRELDAAKLLIESMVAEWEPEQYRDTYRDEVLDLIERKARGETISTERPAEERAPVVDLLAALEKSVAEARERRAQASGGTEVPKVAKQDKDRKHAKDDVAEEPEAGAKRGRRRAS
jgi:DNA end-binding protein Ku